MNYAPTVLIALSLLGCKQDKARDRAEAPAPVPQDVRAPTPDVEPSWYRAVVRVADVEVAFFLGVPAPGVPGEAIFRVGRREVRSAATFDGTTLRVPLTVHQTAVEAKRTDDETLVGTFSTTWRAWGASSIPLTATKVDAPTPRVLATVVTGDVIDLGAARTTWKLATSESGVAKLVIHQTSPGELEGTLFLDTGNIIYLAGTARGDAVSLHGFDGTSAYRLDLTLDADRKRARGEFFGGHRLDWREKLTASRGEEFVLAVAPEATRRGTKIGLPDRPELSALEPGPLVVELAGSWCSTCRNAAPFLVEMYRQYQPRGLRMVTLLYEFSDDPIVDKVQAETFKTTYGVTWPVIPITGSVDDFAEIMPRGLIGLNPAGFPITVFLAADRSLVTVHAGFPAAEASEEYARVTTKFRATVEAMLRVEPE